MGMLMEGFKGLAMGMVIAVEVPVAIVKTAIGNALRKPEKKAAVEETKVDIKNCEPAAKEWIRRCYNKKNGIAA